MVFVASQLTEVGRRKREFETLATEMAVANTHLYLVKKLDEARRGQFKDEMYKSLDFWGYTIRAHFQTAILILCRLYDPQKDDKRGRTLHLLRIVERIEGDRLSNLQISQRRTDLEFLQREEPEQKKYPDRKVANLRAWRKKVFAHRDYDIALDGIEGFSKQHPIDLEETQELIDEGFLILERWASHYHVRRGIQRLVERKNDFLFVLESLGSFQWPSRRDSQN